MALDSSVVQPAGEHIVWGRVGAGVLRKAMACMGGEEFEGITFFDSDDDDSSQGDGSETSFSRDSQAHTKAYPKTTKREGKGKRERMRKQLDQLKQVIELSPFIDVSDLVLPPSIAEGDAKRKESWYAKLLAHQQAIQCGSLVCYSA
mmetsp:Transcript_56305/g.89415  ORF Transcript_56305/g.89415 Transcript_56305/m.89415 type:complete len:147 (+) Transcript_56305:70-510(+)